MLTPAQVIPFLQHEDKKVRTHAAQYLGNAHDPTPATADDFWRAIDRFGLDEAPLTAYLHALPQTEQSYARLVSALRDLDPADSSDGGYHLLTALAAMDWPLLAKHRDEVLNLEKVPAQIRGRLADRLELDGVPFDDLWQRLLTRAKEADERDVNDRENRFDWSVHHRLIEAMARNFPREAGARAEDRLIAGPADDWMEIFCVDLIGAARHREATPLLLQRTAGDADLLIEAVNRALVKFGDPETVAKIEAFYAGKPTRLRLFLDDPLGKIKLPESEAALLRMIRGETNTDILTSIAGELLDLCASPEALEVVRGLVVEGRYDAMMDNLDERLLVVGQMVGYEPPEAPQWRKIVAERDAERAKRVAMFDKMLKEPNGAEKVLMTVLSEMAASARGGKGVLPRPAAQSYQSRARPRRAGLREPSDAMTPVRRNPAKVGRNDPCPCGSGKKYKKCCMSTEDAE